MKKFLSKILRFSIIVSLIFTISWIYLFVNPMSYSSYSYPVTNNIKKYLNSTTDKEVLVIGDSRSMAGISPERLDSSYILSLGGSTPIEGYFTLKNIIKYNKKPKYIILSYAPFHLINHDTYPRPIADNFLNYEDIRELYKDIDSESDMFWDSRKLSFSKMKKVNLLKAYLCKLKFPFFLRAEIINSKFARTNSNLEIAKSIKKNKGSFSYGEKNYCDELNQEASFTGFSENRIIIKYFEKLLKLAEKNEIKVIYYNAPINKASFDNLSIKFKSEFNSFFTKLKELHPKVIFHSQIQYYNNSFFGDRSHLNQSGKLKFSHELNEILKKIKSE